MTSRPIGVLSLAASLLASPAALAGPAECEAVAKAMLAVPDQTAVRQTVMGEDKAEGMASILLKDAMYVRDAPSEPWRKMPVGAALRKQMAERGFMIQPLGDCAAGPDETIDGVLLKSYAFSQPVTRDRATMATSRVLLDPADGLPRRLLMSDGSTMVFEYGDFKAPVP